MSNTSNLTALPVDQFIARTAAREATPGGGSVAGVVGALGASLGEMALAFTRGKKQFAQHEPDYQAIAGRLANARKMFQSLVADDVAAYTLYQQAMSAVGEDKTKQTQLALAAAIDVPREMTALALAVLTDLASLADRCNKFLLSDLAAGGALAEATVRLCDYNVRVNAASYADTAAAEEVRQASDRDCRRATQLFSVIDGSLKTRF